MATTEAAAKRIHAATVTTTAETFALTTPVKVVWVTNASAGRAFVTISTARTAVAAEAGIVTAVADADETFMIPTLTTRKIWESDRALYVAGSIIGNTTTYDVEGSTTLRAAI